jgi:succinate dehydrogenase hydrophobic anchor subunit
LFARSGYAARGAVFIVIGWLALLAAIGGGRTEDSKGALREILSQPFGEVMLGLVALGLLGYAGWRAIQAIRDTDRHGTDAKGLAIRGGLLVSAVTHVLLAVFAISLIFGISSGSGGSQDWTAWLLRQPFGRWLVALIGAAVIGAGLAHIWKGWQAKFEQYLEMDEATRQKTSPICRFGLIARGVVYVMIGAFLVVAAWQADSDEARGLNGALQALQEQPYGWALLLVAALGLVAFGFYSVIEAVYRRIDLQRA